MAMDQEPVPADRKDPDDYGEDWNKEMDRAHKRLLMVLFAVGLFFTGAFIWSIVH